MNSHLALPNGAKIGCMHAYILTEIWSDASIGGSPSFNILGSL